MRALAALLVGFLKNPLALLRTPGEEAIVELALRQQLAVYTL
jgi:hypothetical protein